MASFQNLRLAHTLHLIKGKYHVVVKIPDDISYLYKQKDKRLQRSTSTPDKALAMARAPSIVEAIEKEYGRQRDKLDPFVEGLRHILESEGFDISEWYLKGHLTYYHVDKGYGTEHIFVHRFNMLYSEKTLQSQEALRSSHPSVEAYTAKNYYGLSQMITQLGHAVPQSLLQHLKDDEAAAIRKDSVPNPMLSPEEALLFAKDEPDLLSQVGGVDFIRMWMDDKPAIKLETSDLYIPMFSDWAQTYIKDKAVKDSKDVQAKRKRACNTFLYVCGNKRLDEYDKVHMLEMARYLDNDENQKQWGHKTIKNYYSYVRQAFVYAGEKRNVLGKVVLPQHPFHEVKLTSYGFPTKPYLSLEDEELVALFALPMPQQEYLMFAILITTGMRLDEAALMTWERVSLYKGVYCFGLVDIENETPTLVKNIGSKRYIPIVNSLQRLLPSKGHGRLFNYPTVDGKAENAASKVMMRYIRQITNHPQKAVHSLRGTFKDKMRSLGIEKETHDFITGHAQGDVAGKYGEGPSMDKRLDAMNKVHHPWLTQQA